MSLLTTNVAALRTGGAARIDDGLDRGARRDPRRHCARAGLRRAHAHAAERCPTSRARSATMSIPTRSLPRAKHLRAAIGGALGATLAATYRQMMTPGPYRPDAESAGRRALKNVCLGLLAATGEEQAIKLALASISRRRQHDRPHGRARDPGAARPAGACRTCSTTSMPRYADDPLIIDKWLALQAAIPEPATLDRVAGADRASVLLDGQPEPGALADRVVRAGQPYPIQPARRRRLQFHRRRRARTRSEESASRRPPDGRVPLLARARSQAARAGGGGVCAAWRRHRRCHATFTISSRAHSPTARTRAKAHHTLPSASRLLRGEHPAARRSSLPTSS